MFLSCQHSSFYAPLHAVCLSKKNIFLSLQNSFVWFYLFWFCFVFHRLAAFRPSLQTKTLHVTFSILIQWRLRLCSMNFWIFSASSPLPLILVLICERTYCVRLKCQLGKKKQHCGIEAHLWTTFTSIFWFSGSETQEL